MDDLRRRWLSMVLAAATVAGIAACSASSSPGSGAADAGVDANANAADTGSTAEGGDDGAASYPLDPGTYTGSLPGTTSDTCGSFSKGLKATSVSIAWSSPTQLSIVTAGGLTIQCTLAQGVIGCAPYTQTINVNSTTKLTVHFIAGPIIIISPTSFGFPDPATVDCAGSGCAAFSSSIMASFPCGLTSNFAYSM